jgi:hypothetical protein
MLMGLNFKNILTEDEFPIGKLGNLKPKEEKLLKIIHDNVLIPYFGNFTLPTELLNSYEFVGLYFEIDTFLKDVMLFNDEISSHLFNLFVLNYNIEGNYKDIENVKFGLTYDEELEVFGERVMFLSQHFKTLPFLIEPLEFPYYGMSTYLIKKTHDHYAMANQKDMDNAIDEYIDSIYDIEEDVFHQYGGQTYISYCYVSDTDKRIISGEESNYYESEMSSEEIIDYLNDNGFSTKIVEEYKELEEEWGELPSSKDGSQYELRMEEVVEEGREVVREIVYDDVYNKLENYLTDYLTSMGYIETDSKGYVRVSQDQFDRLPSWVVFNWEEFNDVEKENFEMGNLSPYENIDEVYLDNGDIYYMIQMDY